MGSGQSTKRAPEKGVPLPPENVDEQSPEETIDYVLGETGKVMSGSGLDPKQIEFLLDMKREQVARAENKQRFSKIYRQLNVRKQEIRLLKLSPLADGQNEDDLIECDLITRPIDDAPSFDALSYVWSKPGRWRQVRVNATYFFLQPNLYDVLKTFRNTGQCPRYLWVDAICINQNDFPERSRQVPLMRKIYTQAETVRIWLGCGKPEGIACMIAIARGRPSSNIFQDLARAEELTNSSWFRRLWTVQEALLARRPVAHYGTASLPFKTFVSRCEDWGDEIVRLMNTGSPVDQMKAGQHSIVLRIASVFRHSARVEPEDFLEFMESLSQQKVTNPHDRIYAVMGLAPWLQLKPDYDAPVGSVFEAATAQIMQSSNRFDFLNYAGIRLSNTPGFPSWVIDFEASRRALLTEGSFRTDGGKMCTATASPGTLTAFVLGIDRVAAAAEIQPVSPKEGLDFASANTAIMKRIATARVSTYNHYQPRAGYGVQLFKEAFWRTLHFGSYESNKATEFIDWPEDCVELTASFEHWLQGNRRLAPAHPLYSPASLQVVAMGATIMTTKQRRLAIMRHPGVKAGDLIAVVVGSWFPVVLRANTVNGVKGYQVVGPCYLDGVMHGEAGEAARLRNGDEDDDTGLFTRISLV